MSMSQMARRSSAHGCAWPHVAAHCCATFVIGLTAFLTVVDLFAAQAILPSLAQRLSA